MATLHSLTEAPDPRTNAVLRLLSDQDFERLSHELEYVEMPVRETLYQSGGTFDWIYFPITGMTSTIASSADGMSVEAVSVAREGCTGYAVLLGADASPLEQVQQIPGISARMRVEVFRDELERRGALYDGMRLYGQYLLTVLAQTIVCNRLHDISNRAARWLLQSHDSVDGDTFPLTQEYFATMLGVHRPSVTLAAITLQGANAITYRRGIVTVLDREYLEELACECYAIARAEQKRLLDRPDTSKVSLRVALHAGDGAAAVGS